MKKLSTMRLNVLHGLFWLLAGCSGLPLIFSGTRVIYRLAVAAAYILLGLCLVRNKPGKLITVGLGLQVLLLLRPSMINEYLMHSAGEAWIGNFSPAGAVFYLIILAETVSITLISLGGKMPQEQYLGAFARKYWDLPSKLLLAMWVLNLAHYDYSQISGWIYLIFAAVNYNFTHWLVWPEQQTAKKKHSLTAFMSRKQCHLVSSLLCLALIAVELLRFTGSDFCQAPALAAAAGAGILGFCFLFERRDRLTFAGLFLLALPNIVNLLDISDLWVLLKEFESHPVWFLSMSVLIQLPMLLVLLWGYLALFGSEGQRAKARAHWAMPSALLLAAWVLGAWQKEHFFLNTVQADPLSALASLFFLFWLLFPELQCDAFNPRKHVVTHILLLIFTLGLWYWLWLYRVTAILNRTDEEPRQRPAAQLLLCLLVPFYHAYWIYQSARRLDSKLQKAGVASNSAVLCLLNALLLPVIPMYSIFMQDKINLLTDEKALAVRIGHAVTPEQLISMPWNSGAKAEEQSSQTEESCDESAQSEAEAEMSPPVPACRKAERPKLNFDFKAHKKQLILAGAVLAVLVLVAGGVKLLGGGEAPAPAGESVEMEVIPEKDEDVLDGEGLNATGEVFPLIVTENEDGYCRIKSDILLDEFPDTFLMFAGTPYLGNNIDAYLKNSFAFADLMAWWDQRDYYDIMDWDEVSFRREPESTFCALLFHSEDFREFPTLAGYFVGCAKDLGNGKWEMDLQLCDYHFEEMASREWHSIDIEFNRMYENYIPLSDVEQSGARYALIGYNTGRSREFYEDRTSSYHLWQQLNSDHVDRFARPLDRLENMWVSDDRYRFCLLLDQDYDLIGYTYKKN